MEISAISAATASYETKRQMEKPEKPEKQVKAEPVATNVVTATETRPAAAVFGSETGNNFEQEEDRQPGKDRVRTAVNQVNSKLKLSRTKCEFSYHEPTKRISIKVLDKETNEVIREIPPEETLKMVEKMWELAGILVDERR